MNQIMIEAFLDEINEIEKEAFVGRTIRWTKGLLTRGKGAKKALPKPAPAAAEHTVASGSGTTLPGWGEMDEATRAAAQRLKGPIGSEYRAAAEAATKKPSPADVMKRLQARGGSATPAPGMLPGGGAGAPPPSAAVAFGGAAPAAAPIKATGKTRILTAEQIARNPQMATRGGLEASGGAGLHPEMFQKGRFMGFSSGGKPVYAHVMRKFAQAGLFPALAKMAQPQYTPEEEAAMQRSDRWLRRGALTGGVLGTGAGAYLGGRSPKAIVPAALMGLAGTALGGMGGMIAEGSTGSGANEALWRRIAAKNDAYLRAKKEGRVPSVAAT